MRLDPAQVLVDRAADDRAGRSGRGEPGADRLADLAGDVARHREVEGLLAVEVPVDVRARYARELGDLGGEDVRAVGLDRLDGGLDDRGPPPAPMRIPPGRAAVTRARRAAVGAASAGGHSVSLADLYVTACQR